MKRFLLLPLVAALSIFVSSCDKPQTEAEKNAEIDRQVQQRLDAERQADEQQKLAQRQGELDVREQALAAKENHPAQTAAPVATQSASTHTTTASDSDSGSYSTFYRKLEPYGDWMETSDYGYVFQPRQATQSRDWRPYTNGHWVYTDAGWTWISDEQFGWATYHYGRWVRLRSTGWVWVPGEQWAPAWVSWRKGNNYVGWAPLPPEARFDRQTGIRNWADNYYDIGPEQYAFVPANQFGAKVSARVVVPTERNVTIINQTTNVTNITYNNSMIVDRGPSYDDLRARSSQPIERFRLERTQDFNNERPVFRGEVVALPTLDFRPAERSARPARVVRTLPPAVVERGWSGIQDAQAAQRARAKMKSEATPPPNLPPRRFVKPETTVNPPSSALVNVGRPGARATPVPTASPAVTATPVVTPPPAAEPTQTSPAENIFSPKKADQNQREDAKAAREEKQKHRLQEQEQRRAERQQKLQERRGGRQPEAPEPAVNATASPTATAAPRATPPVATTPAPRATPTPDAPAARDRSQGRRGQPNETPTAATAAPSASPAIATTPAPMTSANPAPPTARGRSEVPRMQQAERRAQRQQRMEEGRGRKSREPAATPAEGQTAAQSADTQAERADNRQMRGKRGNKRRANAAATATPTSGTEATTPSPSVTP